MKAIDQFFENLPLSDEVNFDEEETSSEEPFLLKQENLLIPKNLDPIEEESSKMELKRQAAKPNPSAKKRK